MIIDKDSIDIDVVRNIIQPQLPKSIQFHVDEIVYNNGDSYITMTVRWTDSFTTGEYFPYAIKIEDYLLIIREDKLDKILD